MTHSPNILTVSQITNAIKLCLENTFPNVSVQGEISNFNRHSSGHLYFVLKDAGAQISAAMFWGNARALQVLPKDGDKVIVSGEINVYPSNGRYQIIVKELKQVGIGELLLRLEELKIKINKKGWFRKEHKKPIPKIPKRIGVVTSPTGAAIQDILNILTRRFSGFSLLLNPVRVQGSEAAREIAQAIKQFNDYNLVDVMIVGRGGGSIEDLWAFNEEIVAEAIFNSRIPIIAAVGHETDHSIAEYVADLRAPTPSAAAEMVMAEKLQQLQHLQQLEKRLDQSLFQTIRHCRQKLQGAFKHPLFSSPYYLLGPWMQKLDSLKDDIDLSLVRKIDTFKHLLTARQKHLQSLNPATQIGNFRHKLYYWEKALDQAIRQKVVNAKVLLAQNAKLLDKSLFAKLDNAKGTFDRHRVRKQLHQSWSSALNMKKERLANVSATLRAIDPKNLLSKGYSILFSQKSGSVIKSVRHLIKDEDVRVMLADGKALATIKEVIDK